MSMEKERAFPDRTIYLRNLKKAGWDGGDGYLSRIPAVQNLKRLEFHSPVTFLAGENGCGKSTLLEVIAVTIFNCKALADSYGLPRR